MVVLAHDDSRLGLGVHFGQAGDVDEQSVVNTDEARVDDLYTSVSPGRASCGQNGTHIGSVSSISLPRPRVDIEVVSSLWLTIADFIVVIGLVVVFPEKSQTFVSDLGVEIPVPW